MERASESLVLVLFLCPIAEAIGAKQSYSELFGVIQRRPSENPFNHAKSFVTLHRRKTKSDLHLTDTKDTAGRPGRKKERREKRNKTNDKLKGRLKGGDVK